MFQTTTRQCLLREIPMLKKRHRPFSAAPAARAGARTPTAHRRPWPDRGKAMETCGTCGGVPTGCQELQKMGASKRICGIMNQKYLYQWKG